MHEYFNVTRTKQQWWEIGSHTQSHYSLDSIEENDIVRSELLESKIWIEKNFPNEKTVLKISYPYSKYHEYAKSYFKFCRIGENIIETRYGLEIWKIRYREQA